MSPNLCKSVKSVDTFLNCFAHLADQGKLVPQDPNDEPAEVLLNRAETEKVLLLEEGEYYFINGNNLSDGVIELRENTKHVSVEEFQKHKKELMALCDALESKLNTAQSAQEKLMTAIVRKLSAA